VRAYLHKQETCPNCGGKLRPLGEDVSEILEYVPEQFKVTRQVRPKLVPAYWERIVQAPGAEPSDRARRGRTGTAGVCAGLKYCDHLPLYRQSEMYARRQRAVPPRRSADQPISHIEELLP
jgi:transposase